jgi:non-lysosomal glucosylceramidase
MKTCRNFFGGSLLLFFLIPSLSLRADDIPKAAWKRGIGAPLENPGKKKPTLDRGHIDDGFWQGVPVGGFGAGTFSRTYRGDFARWHLQGGVHKYQVVDANQFAIYQKTEGDTEGVAQVLTVSHPNNKRSLDSWKWDYPVGAGDYYALYPKAWFDYRWDKFPAHVVVEQFSPVLPNNYKESSYPVAIYRWHAENPTNRRVTVSILLSWENMLGWFRTFNRDLSGSINAGNFNRPANEVLGAAGTMKGIVFERNHVASVQEAWDGQVTIAAIESPGAEVTYQTTLAEMSKQYGSHSQKMESCSTTTIIGRAAVSH